MDTLSDEELIERFISDCKARQFSQHTRESYRSTMLLFLTYIRQRKKALEQIQPIESFNDGMPFSEEIKIEMFTHKKIRSKEIPSMLRAREGEVKIESFSDGIKNLKFLFLKRVGK